jgi:ABC-type glutathione transport system ATPase component
VSAEGPLLAVEDLQVEFPGREGPVAAVRGLSWELRSGEVLALVGESGSGKTTTALALLGLLRRDRAHVQGRALYRDEDLLALPEERLRRIRGNEIALAMQDPATALDPVMRVGAQVAEAVRAQAAVDRSAARARAVEALEHAGVPDAAELARRYPHELSGGLRRRALIAMALAGAPQVLLADEPTGGLDPTVARTVAGLLDALRRELGGVVLITHDLPLVAELADRMLVMRAGEAVEEGPVAEVMVRPQHPYTAQLLAAVPRLRDGAPAAA